MAEQQPQQDQFESIRLQGEQLVERVQQLIQEGNASRVTIRHGDRTVAEFPLTVGAAGAVAAVAFAPLLAAVGAIAALIADVTVEVERKADDSSGSASAGGDSSGAGGGSQGSGSAGGSAPKGAGTTGGGATTSTVRDPSRDQDAGPSTKKS